MAVSDGPTRPEHTLVLQDGTWTQRCVANSQSLQSYQSSAVCILAPQLDGGWCCTSHLDRSWPSPVSSTSSWLHSIWRVHSADESRIPGPARPRASWLVRGLESFKALRRLQARCCVFCSAVMGWLKGWRERIGRWAQVSPQFRMTTQHLYDIWMWLWTLCSLGTANILLHQSWQNRMCYTNSRKVLRHKHLSKQSNNNINLHCTVYYPTNKGTVSI